MTLSQIKVIDLTSLKSLISVGAPSYGNNMNYYVHTFIHIICAVSGCSLIRHIPDRPRRTFKLAVSYDMLVSVEQERSLMHYPKRFNWPQQSFSLRWLIPSRRGLR